MDYLSYRHRWSYSRQPASPHIRQIQRLGAITLLLLGSSCAPALRPSHSGPTFSSVRVPSARSEIVTLVPFELVGGTILVHATIDGWSGEYVLDTGAPVVALNCLVVHPAGAPQSCGHPSSNNSGTDQDYVQIGFQLHTMRVGTLTLAIDSVNDDIVRKHYKRNGILSNHPGLAAVQQATGRPITGVLGLNVLAPFETIIDYSQQRLVLIRLDAAGHRLAPVPAYTPRETIPLIELKTGHYALQGNVDGASAVFLIDTGAWEFLSDTCAKRMGQQHVMKRDDGWFVDRISVGGRSIDSLWFEPLGNNRYNIVGPLFLRRLSGTVGFNLRTRQLVLYD